VEMELLERISTLEGAWEPYCFTVVTCPCVPWRNTRGLPSRTFTCHGSTLCNLVKDANIS
jgi:hypothetical protein